MHAVAQEHSSKQRAEARQTNEAKRCYPPAVAVCENSVAWRCTYFRLLPVPSCQCRILANLHNTTLIVPSVLSASSWVGEANARVRTCRGKMWLCAVHIVVAFSGCQIDLLSDRCVTAFPTAILSSSTFCFVSHVAVGSLCALFVAGTGWPHCRGTHRQYCNNLGDHDYHRPKKQPRCERFYHCILRVFRDE